MVDTESGPSQYLRFDLFTRNEHLFASETMRWMLAHIDSLYRSCAIKPTGTEPPDWPTLDVRLGGCGTPLLNDFSTGGGAGAGVGGDAKEKEAEGKAPGEAGDVKPLEHPNEPKMPSSSCMRPPRLIRSILFGLLPTGDGHFALRNEYEFRCI